MDSINRRGASRIPFHAMARVVTKKGQLNGLLMDISEQGLLFCAARRLDASMLGACEVSLLAGNLRRCFTTRGQVVRVNREFMGIRFESLGCEQRDCLAGILSADPIALAANASQQNNLCELSCCPSPSRRRLAA